MDKLVTSITTAALAIVVTLPMALAVLVTGDSVAACQTADMLTPGATSPAGTPPRPESGWDAEQRANATTILTVGTRLGVPPRGQVIALATAMQESSLHNLPGGDRDSIGLFQQRPSAGWGNPTQLRDPAYAAARFYRSLLAVPEWPAMPLTDAAQTVQRSAYPEAYADDEAPAAALFAELTGDAAGMDACAGLTAVAALSPLPTRFTPPTPANPTLARVIGWALLQVGTPYSYGGDCTAAHSGLAERQCDCSSLTLQAYARAGISLPRTAADQSRVGVPVPLSAIQPGDLLFSAGADGSPSEPGHVAMALSNDWIIEAPRTGLTVRVTRLTPDRTLDIVAVRRVVTS